MRESSKPLKHGHAIYRAPSPINIQPLKLCSFALGSKNRDQNRDFNAPETAQEKGSGVTGRVLICGEEQGGGSPEK